MHISCISTAVLGCRVQRRIFEWLKEKGAKTLWRSLNPRHPAQTTQETTHCQKSTVKRVPTFKINPWQFQCSSSTFMYFQYCHIRHFSVSLFFRSKSNLPTCVQDKPMVEDPSSLSSAQMNQLRLYEAELWKKACRTLLLTPRAISTKQNRCLDTANVQTPKWNRCGWQELRVFDQRNSLQHLCQGMAMFLEWGWWQTFTDRNPASFGGAAAEGGPRMVWAATSSPIPPSTQPREVDFQSQQI